MENKSHAMAAGAFVLVLLALLVGLAVWLTRDSSVQRIYELSSKEAVTGLQAQASVRFKGVNVGKVTAIGFDTQTPGNVLIRIAIDERAPVTQSTFGSLGFQGVTGLAFVQLDDKGESTVALPANTTPPARIPMRTGLMSRLTEQGEAIMTQLETSSRRINELLAPANQKQLMGAVDSLGQAANSIAAVSNAAAKSLPQLTTEVAETLKIMKDTSDRVGDSADEARKSARAFRTVTERMDAPGGMLDQVTRGTETLAATAQTLNAATLPRLNRAVDDAARALREVGRTVSTVNDNPQSLILGNAPAVPGPGEPGFSVGSTAP
ncbi:MAG: MlaD family protein [Rhodoferax sp.]|nr:MlaD family protein [Rhodoferax sp.]